MSRIGLLNLFWGFLLVLIAACGGAFVAAQLSQNYVMGQGASTWQNVLQASSHGHTTLFGVIHIAFGLTIPYTRASPKILRLETAGLMLGSVAMGPLLLVRAALGPTLSTELNGLVLGGCLSCFLLAILAHVIYLGQRLMSRV